MAVPHPHHDLMYLESICCHAIHATTNLNTFDFTPQPLLPLKKETYTVYYILYLLLLPARPKTIHCKNSSPPPPPPHVLGSVHTLLTKLSCSRCLSVCLVSSPSGQYTWQAAAASENQKHDSDSSIMWPQEQQQPQ